jgi:acyl-ACP thioesterase
LIESAVTSARELGFGIESLQEQGLTWVLGRIHVVLDEPLLSNEELEIETWPSGLLRSTATREFRILKGEREVGRATSIWFVLDMTTRLPVHPAEVMPPSMHERTPSVLGLSRALKSFSESPEIEHRFNVRFSDIDRNQHVTAASYIAWAMEALPTSLWSAQRLASLDVQFLAECHHGSEIVTSSVALETTPAMRLHRIARSSDGRELARLCTTWVNP